MPSRRLPVRPDLDQLRHQAKELLRDVRSGGSDAIAEFRAFHPRLIEPADARLSDAQMALARSYGVKSWPRLVLACSLIEAIWEDRTDVVRQLITRCPRLLHENARATEKCNWGPPMSYAANLGRDEIIETLHGLGATDHARAMNRAVLQSRIGTARRLHEMGGRPEAPAGSLNDPAYTLSVEGTALMLELGAQVVDGEGRRVAPVDVVLETDSRKPEAKHAILEMYARHGLTLPDTPAMALHRGRIDLLDAHLRRDPELLTHTFSHDEIYPPEMGCHDAILATHGTPLNGATVLHMCVDFDEWEIANWLLERGMDVDARAAVDGDGFGGHTALFASVVSQPNFWTNYQRRPPEARFTQLLLHHGADPNARASLRKQLHPGYGEDVLHEYRDVTPLAWGRRFHRQVFVSEPAMRLIEEHGGME